MKQVSQEMKRGAMHVEDVPEPALRHGGVIVRNEYSLISAGTERSSVQKRKESLLSKVRSNPDMVKHVLNQMRQQGVWNVYRKVMTKLDAYGPLGYSSAGTVIGVANDIDDFRIGDRIACGGSSANHAEVLFVPKNLCVKVPTGLSMREAAFTTVGAIALQGVRQAAPTLGETIAVIGLGLVGQLTVQILKAAGCSVIGIDIDQRSVALARSLGADVAFQRSSRGLVTDIQSQTRGSGVDAVIITAATKSSDPVELAGEIARDKARVILVGDVGISIPRTPYYMKELDFKISRSYGPGRYDKSYEEKGQDYPVGFVRWTEKRNMEEFLKLVLEKKVNVEKLTTHTFPIADALKAYTMIAGRTKERYIGVLLEYPHKESPGQNIVSVSDPRPSKGLLSVGFIGAGSFAQSSLIPFISGKSATLKGVCTSNGLNAKNAARKFGFEFATTDPKEIFALKDVDVVFIATRHNLHASLCVEAIKHHKHVFVEKPLALNEKELSEVIKAYESSKKQSHLRFMVGFNRRFSPQVRRAKAFFADAAEPMLVNYRVNAGFLPKEHWTQDPVEGGGRIIGEVCHFIDTIQYITNGEPTHVFAQSLSLSGDRSQTDNVAVTIRFSNGSVGVITYLANGDSALPKERIEIFSGGKTAIIDNFKVLETYHGGSRKVFETPSVEKGHKTEVEEFINSVHLANDLIPFQSLVVTTRATFKIIESLECGLPVEL
ncbi:MAG: bi-domain-containing oxidoreductase [Bacteroidota bacterium]